jgi:hypothetical protein
MPAVTLLEKVYPPFSPKMFEAKFTSLCEDLRVRLAVAGRTDRGWLQIDVSGEDETAALNVLDREIGLAPVYSDSLEKFSTMKGRVVSPRRGRVDLHVDVGVFSPQIIDAAIKLENLQAQLADGKKLPLKKLIEIFCLQENFPLEIEIVGSPNVQNGCVEADLSEGQLSRIAEWIRSSLDRLIILGATFSDVENAIKKSKHSRDIIKIEFLGLLEHAVECKLGTDAVGLIPKLGPLLSAATLVSFSPRKIGRTISRSFQ